MLLEHNADINVKSYDGRTALIRASQKGYEEIVNILLKYNADTTIRDISCFTALDYALYAGNSNIIKMLENHQCKK
ncbi:ankyrin repeat domain-containing protein [Brachyspira hampsonii]|uniref:ankyrin repeat domain-containing protein n=1 Tax=Brachyspira hampsonii TaxID=1287055 RepID=UPI002159FE33|nr:ankyrin repeat domain-containing protein [Brachyspira hampsonii]